MRRNFSNKVPPGTFANVFREIRHAAARLAHPRANKNSINKHYVFCRRSRKVSPCGVAIRDARRKFFRHQKYIDDDHRLQKISEAGKGSQTFPNCDVTIFILLIVTIDNCRKMTESTFFHDFIPGMILYTYIFSLIIETRTQPNYRDIGASSRTKLTINQQHIK